MILLLYPTHYAVLFFFTHPATAQIYTLSLHDALPISMRAGSSAVAPSSSNGRNALVRKNGDFRFRSSTLSQAEDRKSTRLNSSHSQISYAVFCLKKKNSHTAIS